MGASQHGEDRILASIFARLGVDRGTCVEFGAWDGIKHSNTRDLILSGWAGVMIEANPERFKDLQETYRDRPEVLKLNRIVGFDSPDTLDEILAGIDFFADFDLLSIDIDGNDYHVWDAVKQCMPKVVVIEFNPTMPNEVGFVQVRDMSVNHGSSLLALNELAARKGYSLAAATECNAVFVRNDLFPVLGITDNSLAVLHPGNLYHTYILQMYDGTLALHGFNRLLWHDAPVRIEVTQPLSREQRRFNDALSKEK